MLRQEHKIDTTHFSAQALLLFFGVSTLLDANGAEEAAAEEKADAQEAVEGFGTGKRIRYRRRSSPVACSTQTVRCT